VSRELSLRVYPSMMTTAAATTTITKSQLHLPLPSVWTESAAIITKSQLHLPFPSVWTEPVFLGKLSKDGMSTCTNNCRPRRTGTAAEEVIILPQHDGVSHSIAALFAHNWVKLLRFRVATGVRHCFRMGSSGCLAQTGSNTPSWHSPEPPPSITHPVIPTPIANKS
jgi:hypothetical protein